MRKLSFALSVVLPVICLLLSAGTGLAQGVTGARMTWYGVYTAKTTTSESATKTISTGITPPDVNSDRIVLTGSKMMIGYGYKLLGGPSSRLVDFTYRTIFPDHQVQDNIYRRLAIGRQDLFIGQILESDSQTGKYSIQLWQNGRMLLEKTFTVSR